MRRSAVTYQLSKECLPSNGRNLANARRRMEQEVLYNIHRRRRFGCRRIDERVLNIAL